MVASLTTEAAGKQPSTEENCSHRTALFEADLDTSPGIQPRLTHAYAKMHIGLQIPLIEDSLL